mmetsp:Transcript_6268/g.25160  ORF Transcript_6268/g.25160 Transcript_6268/m.25160 type:complete len:334 (-) Transcript_6268:648-1649(-)
MPRCWRCPAAQDAKAAHERPPCSEPSPRPGARGGGRTRTQGPGRYPRHSYLLPAHLARPAVSRARHRCLLHADVGARAQSVALVSPSPRRAARGAGLLRRRDRHHQASRCPLLHLVHQPALQSLRRLAPRLGPRPNPRPAPQPALRQARHHRTLRPRVSPRQPHQHHIEPPRQDPGRAPGHLELAYHHQLPPKPARRQRGHRPHPHSLHQRRLHRPFPPRPQPEVPAVTQMAVVAALKAPQAAGWPPGCHQGRRQRHLSSLDPWSSVLVLQGGCPPQPASARSHHHQQQQPRGQSLTLAKALGPVLPQQLQQRRQRRRQARVRYPPQLSPMLA